MSLKNAILFFSLELLVYNVCSVLERNTYSGFNYKCTIKNPTLVQQRIPCFLQTSLILVKIHFSSWIPLQMIACKFEVQNFTRKRGASNGLF